MYIRVRLHALLTEPACEFREPDAVHVCMYVCVHAWMYVLIIYVHGIEKEHQAPDLEIWRGGWLGRASGSRLESDALP